MHDESNLDRASSSATTDRRRFLGRILKGSVLMAGAGAVLASFSLLRRKRKSVAGMRSGLGILRPPGALPEEAFMAACIRCTRCADACSMQAIQYFGAEAGALQGTPYIEPIDAACNMCLACGASCPTGALLPLARKEDIRIGTAVVDDRLCVSINGSGICGACYTACPLRGKAITQGIRNAPEVHPEFCTGCGLCEAYCIVDDRPGLRAIQVYSEAVGIS